MQGQIIYKDGEIKEVYGYKAFHNGLLGYNDFKFEVGKKYTCDDILAKHKGFHFCLRLEDTLRYFLYEENIEICLVKGTVNIQKFDDEYFGYYELFVCDNLEILKKVSREDIIEYYKHLKISKYNEYRFCRFVRNYPLIETEKKELQLDKRKIKFIY